VADGLAGRFSAVAGLLTEAEADLLVHFTFPEAIGPRIRSTNPQERLNKEIPVLDWYLPEGPRRRPRMVDDRAGA
jgi:transposase-like protein